jgi:hypothetical protein
MKNIGQMLKQAQQVQEKMARMQEELGHIEMTGDAGAGLVTVALNGKGEMKRLYIDQTLMSAEPENKETLEDLIVAAHNDARKKVDAHSAAEMSKVTGGLQLPPGMKLPF